ncbi:hypothetical protein EXIGUO8H_180005 [Exiguobacterium sp. 8H]|uniref:hypothetical protein n=1 Tax=unclassified Exiguobacterium TaxID=2644629 RepID=UPI0012F43DFE|nr:MULTISPECIES: hypothetical protein [unclassified Exiguobacterium]VXB39103.1 hypothetical protein EXIGUO8H_180005 [Exiguobacterium sp. 8H]VXB98887.1 hypothetical protein EXIGUO8A_510002 [Exiguobacterium sp. 8A]
MARIGIKVSPETHERLDELRIEQGFSSFEMTISFLYRQLKAQQEIDDLRVRQIETLQKQNAELHRAFLNQEDMMKHLKKLIGSVESIDGKMETWMLMTRPKR